MAKEKSYGRTEGGILITDRWIEERAAEAEAGYDVEKILARRRARAERSSAAQEETAKSEVRRQDSGRAA
jgi:hypothetical protein